jgi:hypothetical protein
VAPQVPKDKAVEVAAKVTAENLNRALASSGISVDTVSSPKIKDTGTTSFGGLGVAGLAGIGAGGFVSFVAAAAGACCWVHSRRAQQEQITADVRIPTRPAP